MNGMRIRQAMCWRAVVLNPQCVLKSEPSRGCLNICGLHTDDSDLVGLVWDMMSGISINSKFPGDLSAPGSGSYPLRRTAVDRSASLKPKHLLGGNTGKSYCPGKSTQEVLKASILLTLFSLLVILHLRGTIKFFFFSNSQTASWLRMNYCERK